METNRLEKGKLVPPQNEGTEITVRRSVVLKDTATAKAVFLDAKNRLEDVNNWHRYIDGPVATFQLTDENGRKLDGKALQGLYIRVDIPGPGAIAGHGYDWVQIDAKEEEDEEALSYLAFRVRPSRNPENREDEVAHFFSEDATSTFVVMREGSKVSCSVYERNLKANVSTGEALDSVRNAVVGNVAAMGLSRLQWEQLASAMLEEK